MGLFGKARRAFLLYVLVLVAGGTWITAGRTTSWERTLWVTIHPINGDGSARSADYIAGLEAADFQPIASFLREQAARYGIALRDPFHVSLGAPVREQPPQPPYDGNLLEIAAWSLSLRYWGWRVDKGAMPPPSDIDIYVRYFDPRQRSRLSHSLGLQKGLIGVVNAFAETTQAGSNNVIIAHELLHTLGATDKYDRVTNQPRFPGGFAAPDSAPRFPQSRAELMGGRIPLSPTQSQIPASLSEVVIGPETAREIRWIR